MADERDPKVSQRYRALGGEEPSRELDQAILAAAHRAADKPHAPLVPPVGRHRWYFAFGAAAILVLAVAVTVHVERDRPDAESIVLKDQVRPQEAPASKASPSSEAPPAKDASRAKPKTEAPPPPAAPRESAEVARSDRPEARGAPAPTQSQPESREQSPAADAVRQSRVASAAILLSPERLLERIAELRKEGRHNEADQALAEFRARYPDYRIPTEMLEKIERKK